MKIIRYNFFTLHDLKELFSSVGWKSAEAPEMLQKAFISASHVVSAWNNETLVGIIHSMDDGIWCANIDCLVVHKKYQGRGISKLLLSELLKDLKNVRYINVCPDELISFYIYKPFGFKLIQGCYIQKINL